MLIHIGIEIDFALLNLLHHAVQVSNFDTEPGLNRVSFGSTGARVATSECRTRSVESASFTTATTAPAISPVCA